MNVDDSEISLVKVQFDFIFVKNLAVVEHLWTKCEISIANKFLKFGVELMILHCNIMRKYTIIQNYTFNYTIIFNFNNFI